MKKILEILQYGETDIRFKTDLKPTTHPDDIPSLIGEVSLAMMTTLWGGNELDVLAVIRTLAIADLALCVNRKEMIRSLDKESEVCARLLEEARREFNKNGGKFVVVPPYVNPPKTRS